jgi:predicted aspartyl protease
MTTEGPADGGGIVFPVASKKRRRREPPFFLISAVIVAAAAVGGWFYFHPISTNGERPWILPPGLPSLSEAYICQRDGDIPCAEADLVAYTKKYPTDPKGYGRLAILLTQDGRHKESLYYYQKAESMGVATYDLDAGYAKSLDATGQIDAAMVRNRAALDIYPQLVDVREALAGELVRKGRGKEALDLLESFDRQLEDEGQQPYFTAQIKQMKLNLGGDYAKQALAANPSADPVAAPGQIIVKGVRDGGTLLVPVSIAGAPATSFMVDSGASTISMPSANAAALFKTGRIGPENFMGRGVATMANGSIVPVEVYNLRSVTVGGREIRNVPISIYRGYGPNLLGQTFLRRFKSWSIDNGRHELVLTD